MQWVIGIDEVGRGCLAGPVMVGVFAIRESCLQMLDHKWIKDSKVLSAERRRAVLEYLDDCVLGGDIRYAVAMQDASVIDEIGIIGAIRLCISEGLSAVDIPPVKARVYLDGGLRAPDEWIYQSTHIKGDRDYPVISAASIIAKVTRDEYMVALAAEYPEYGWKDNKGYGTLAHRNVIAQKGMTSYHRKLFCSKVNRVFA